MPVLDEGGPDAPALGRGRDAEELQSHVRRGRKALVIGLDLLEHAKQTARRVGPTAFEDGTKTVRAHRVGRRPMSLGAEPAGDSGNRFARDDDVGILGKRRRHERSEEVGQDRRALAIIGEEDDRSGIRLECGREDARAFVNVFSARRPNSMHGRLPILLARTWPRQAADSFTVLSCVRT